ncbi:MAG: UDP-N-acetylglucosamine 4-epimerase [Chlamydiae bacterium]|nr:UDP-N-acetylglucosamine 4-epimerase [Chlamydiota bacterium]
MSILITGIAGFIGFHTAMKLKHLNKHVLGIDNFCGTDESLFLKHQRSHLLKQNDIFVFKGDINQKNCFEKIFDENNDVYAILHFAAQPGIFQSMQNPKSYIKDNINGFVSVLETCIKYGVSKLLYASSSSVYGHHSQLPMKETESHSNSSNLYSLTKRTNEMLADIYHKNYGISTLGLRFFSVYGPLGRPDMAYYVFTKNVLNRIPVLLHGKGMMARDYTYIEDVLEGIVAVLESSYQNEVFNLGSGTSYTLYEMLRIIQDKLGIQASIQKTDNMFFGVQKTLACNEKSERMLGYLAKTKFQDGLHQFIDWYLEYKNAKNLKLESR